MVIDILSVDVNIKVILQHERQYEISEHNNLLKKIQNKISIKRLTCIFVCIAWNLTIWGENERYGSQLLNQATMIAKKSINEFIQSI